MRLRDLVARYPTVRLATAEDNASILAFFERAPMDLPAFALEYRRSPDFFRLLRYQAERAYVFITVDDGGAVRSLGSVSLRPGWVGGEPTTVGYLGDLRVGFDRRAVTLWRRFYGDLLSRAGEIEELADVTHWFTTVIDDNALARRALGAGRADAPAHLPLASFTMRNLVARLPFAAATGAARASRRWSVGGASSADRAPLAAFFEHEQRALPLGFRGEIERRLGRWEGLAIEDFVCATEGGEIVACVAPWSPATAKRMVVSRVPAGIRWLGRAARALPRRPVRIPAAGEAVRTLYLTHLTFAARLSADQRATAFRAMLDHLFDGWRREAADWHCVALCDFNEWSLGRALGGYVQQTLPITVYAVMPPGAPHDGATALRRAGPPAFEMAMV